MRRRMYLKMSRISYRNPKTYLSGFGEMGGGEGLIGCETSKEIFMNV